jgi:hypothetical protein
MNDYFLYKTPEDAVLHVYFNGSQILSTELSTEFVRNSAFLQVIRDLNDYPMQFLN